MNDKIKRVKDTDDFFAKNWFSEEIDLMIGLYCLVHSGDWKCTFVSDNCHKILGCDENGFIDTLFGLNAYASYQETGKTVKQLLDDIAGGGEPCAFISICPRDDKGTKYIKGIHAVSRNADGSIQVYGQMEDVSKEQEKMVDKAREDCQIFHITAQHSNRILYAYDLATRTTRPWDRQNREKDILAHLYTNAYSGEKLPENPFVLPESIQEIRKFFSNIHQGVPTGEMKIHIRLSDGKPKWYHFKYSNIYENDTPVTALISIKDITGRHQKEVAYRRYQEEVRGNQETYVMCIECDLTGNLIEYVYGKLVTKEEQEREYIYSDFGNVILSTKFRFEDAEGACRYFSGENLLSRYTKGERKLSSQWKVSFPDGSAHWLDTEIVMMEDPYSEHVKAFFHIKDGTQEYEQQISIKRRADFDGMTGLLRKIAGEEMITKQLERDGGKGGVMILLDLDDLKGINDSLGHAQGDAAIIGVADTLKSHFRRDDILVRMGGDEFIAFLPKAGQNEDAVKHSMASLLRKLSGIHVGENGERTIHCSAGCAVEECGKDTFESLFRRADLALYHVKRHGKNHFAFYEPQMFQEDYEFKRDQAVPAVSNIMGEEDLKHLWEVTAVSFPGIIQFNLTNDYFRILNVGSNIKFVPMADTIDEFWAGWAETIHPEDRVKTLSCLSKNGLFELYTGGEECVKFYFRSLEGGEYEKTEVTVSFYTTNIGDVCAFIFFRWEIKEQ